MKRTLNFIKQLGYFKTISCFIIITILFLIGLNYKPLTTKYTSREDVLKHPIYSTLLSDLETIKVQDYGSDLRKKTFIQFFEISLTTESKLSKEYIEKGDYLEMNDIQLYKSVIELITKSFTIENKGFKENGIPENVINSLNSILNSDINGFYEQVDRVFKDPNKKDKKYNSEKMYKLFNLVNGKWEKVTTYIKTTSNTICIEEIK